MKKLIYFIVLICFLIIPEYVFAYSTKLYLFHRDTCPHCRDEIEYLNTIENKYPELEIIKFEVENDLYNNNLLRMVKETLGDDNSYIPYTVVGNERIIGYSEYSNSNIESLIESCIENDCPDVVGTVIEKGESLTVDELNELTINYKKNENEEKNIPILGNVNVKNTAIPLMAIILGFIDGFNPCAMWILIFLISILLGLKDRKKIWLFGFTFLFFSELVYFLSMLGINIVLSFTSIKIIRILIATVAVIAGGLNLKKFFTTKNSGCSVSKSEKRVKISTKINKFIKEKNLFIALLGIASLGISVNLVELSCSLGFPVVYSEILAINNITGISKILYILLYILFYMLDDIIVFVIAVATFKLKGISNRFGKISHLIGGIIMILLGILLIFKPEWIMFNFN